jgi:hypothetical protein
MMKNAKEIIAAITTMTAEKLAWLVANDERKSVRDRAEARLRALAKEEQEILAEEDEQEQQPEVEYEVCEACGCVRCCCDAVDEPEPVELLQDAGLDEAEAEAVVAAGVEPANEDEAAAVVDVVAAAGQAVLVAAEAEDVTEPGAWEPEGEGVEIGSVEPGQMVRSKSGRLVIVVGPSEEAVTEDGRLFQRAGYRTVIDHVTEVGIVRGTGVSPSTPVWPLTEAEQAYEAAIAGAVERRVAGDKEKAAAREAEAQRRLERAGARKAEKKVEREERAAVKVAEGGGGSIVRRQRAPEGWRPKDDGKVAKVAEWLKIVVGKVVDRNDVPEWMPESAAKYAGYWSPTHAYGWAATAAGVKVALRKDGLHVSI